MRTPGKQSLSEHELSDRERYSLIVHRQQKLLSVAHWGSIVLATCEQKQRATREDIVRALEEITENKHIIESILFTDKPAPKVRAPKEHRKLAEMQDEARMALLRKMHSLYAMTNTWTGRLAREDGREAIRKKDIDGAFGIFKDKEILRATLRLGRYDEEYGQNPTR